MSDRASWPIGLPWDAHGLPLGHPWYGHGSRSWVSLMGLPWVAHGLWCKPICRPGLSWVAHGSSTDYAAYPWASHGLPMEVCLRGLCQRGLPENNIITSAGTEHTAATRSSQTAAVGNPIYVMVSSHRHCKDAVAWVRRMCVPKRVVRVYFCLFVFSEA